MIYVVHQHDWVEDEVDVMGVFNDPKDAYREADRIATGGDLEDELDMTQSKFLKEIAKDPDPERYETHRAVAVYEDPPDFSITITKVPLT